MCVLELRGGGVGDGHSRWHLQRAEEGNHGGLRLIMSLLCRRTCAKATILCTWEVKLDDRDGFYLASVLVPLWWRGLLLFHQAAAPLSHPRSPAGGEDVILIQWLTVPVEESIWLSLNWVSCHSWEGFDRFGFFNRLLRMSWSPWIKTFQRLTISVMCFSPSLFLIPHLHLPLLPPVGTPV